MPLFAGKTPKERYQTIAALALGLVALLFLIRMFFGSSKPTPTNTNRPRASRPGQQSSNPAPADGVADDLAAQMPQPIPAIRTISFDGQDGGRNIFTFYVPPTPTPTPIATP